MKNKKPEMPTIRPPSEWRSMLIRSTRGCNWNRCKFCGIYSALGVPQYSERPISDVKSDIDWYADNMSDLETAFIGDADPFNRPFEESLEIIRYLHERMPNVRRITAYARASTIWKIGLEGLNELKKAGLDRIHTGLETGNKELLKYHFKGQSPKMIVETGKWIVHAGIDLSYYVLLGLGGTEKWEAHIDDTATIINLVNPDFIRIRRLWIYSGDYGMPNAESPLWKEIREGNFIQQTPEGTVKELYRLISKLKNINSELLCDHANNYINIRGRIPEEKDKMLAEIESFLSLPEETLKGIYNAVGSHV